MRWETVVFAVAMALVLAPEVDGQSVNIFRGRSVSLYNKTNSVEDDEDYSSEDDSAAALTEGEAKEPPWAVILHEEHERQEREEKEARQQQQLPSAQVSAPQLSEAQEMQPASSPDRLSVPADTLAASAAALDRVASTVSPTTTHMAAKIQHCDQLEDVDGYVRMPGTQSRYRFFKKPMDWWTAKKTCERQGAHLAVANTEVEAMALVYLMRMAHFPGHPTHMHVGVSDNEEEGVWRTVDGSEFNNTYVRWAPNQPEINNKNQNCMQLYSNLGNVDFNCNGKVSFACEKSAYANQKGIKKTKKP